MIKDYIVVEVEVVVVLPSSYLDLVWTLL